MRARALSVLLRFVSRPELASRPVRSLLMIGTIAVGIALLTAMHVATDSIVSGFAGDLERLAGKADLQVTFGTGEAGFPEELLQKVAAQPFVAQAAALVHSQITFEGGQPETVELFGIDVMQKDVLDLYEVEVLEREKDDFTILNDPRGVFVTDVIARERGLALGSKVRLSAVDGVHDYTVRGIVATRGLAAFLGGRLVAMFLPAAQPVAGRKGDLRTSMIDQIDIRLRAGTDVDAASATLERLLEPGYRVDTPMQRRLVGEHTVEGLRATLVGMSSLALLAAIFIIYASMTTMVAQRLPAMATLATIGAGPKILIRAMVAEAAILGLIGSAVGVVLGLGLASFIGEDAAAGMGLNYSLPFDAARASYNPFVVFFAHPLGGILTASFSAFLPARQLRHVTPLVLQRDQDSLLHRSIVSLWGALLAAAIPGGIGALALRYGVMRAQADWVSFGGILLIIASVLATLPVLRAVWTRSIPLLSRLAGVAGRIAGENLHRTLDRSLVTASAITLSVAVAVGAGSLVESFRVSVAGWYGFAGDALVSSRAVTGGWMAAPVARALERSLRQLDSVADVQTLRVLQGQPYHGERIAMSGLSEGLLREAVEKGQLVGGLGFAEAVGLLARGEAVAVSQNFVTHFGLPESGGRLALATVTGEVRFPVVAVVPDYVSDQGSVLLARDLLASRWNDDLVNYFAIDLKAGTSVEALAAEVDRSGAEGLAVMATSRMMERVSGFIGEAFADIDTIKLLVLFLTAVGITDLVVSNVLSRRRELAVLRIVGLTNAQVIHAVRLEGICVTVGAAICGAVVGTFCAWLWVHYNYPALVGYVLELKIAWGSVAASLAMAGVSASVAATLAARYALRQPALSTIRFD